MKKLALVLPFSIFSTSQLVHSQEVNLAQDFYSYGYFGINFGNASVSGQDSSRSLSLTTAGISGGYQISKIFGVECAAYVSVLPEKDKALSALIDTPLEVDYSAIGAYATIKTKGDFYIKGRAGLAQSSITYSSDGYRDEKESNFGFSGSIGAGYQSKSISYDLEYTLLPNADNPLIDETYKPKIISLTVGFNL